MFVCVRFLSRSGPNHSRSLYPTWLTGFVGGSSTAAFPLFGVQMYEKLGYQWASSVLAFLTVAMLPFPYIFFRYGKQIRGKSRYAAKS